MRTMIQRFTFGERAAHWMAALSFVYAALTGLALWTQKLYWLASVFGGGPVTRATHPWVGVVFAASLGLIFLRWASQMRLSADDRRWLILSHQYATHREAESGIPDAGRFNGGQKMLFWVQSGLALVLFATGIVLWNPEWMPRWARLIAILLHPVAALGSIAGIILHMYMGAVVIPGALHAMLRGEVTAAWARHHHKAWKP